MVQNQITGIVGEKECPYKSDWGGGWEVMPAPIAHSPWETGLAVL